MSKFKDLNSLEEVNDFINQNELAFLYFTTPNCSVCHGLQPQIEEMMTHYPEISTRHIDASLVPEAAGQYSVFTAPVRSEERRVGKESRSRRWRERATKKSKM